MKINNTEIKEGGYTRVKMRVGYLPSGTEINIFAHVYRAVENGKVALILAGVHGDEINGVETIRRTIENGMYENLLRGTVIVVPLLNVFGFINFSREVPDGKDVNRSFPGNNVGSLAARVARKLTKSILPLVDFGIDFHTGGDARYNFPQVRYTKGDPAAKELADVFNAPFTIARTRIPKTLRKVAGDQGIPVIVFEGGESKRLDGRSINTGIRGIERVLRFYEMLTPEEDPTLESVGIVRTGWIRAPEAGLFIWQIDSGNKVTKGEVLGVVKDVHGKRSINIIAKTDGYIIGYNNAPVVNSGDALFHIGFTE